MREIEKESGMRSKRKAILGVDVLRVGEPALPHPHHHLYLRSLFRHRSCRRPRPRPSNVGLRDLHRLDHHRADGPGARRRGGHARAAQAVDSSSSPASISLASSGSGARRRGWPTSRRSWPSSSSPWSGRSSRQSSPIPFCRSLERERKSAASPVPPGQWDIGAGSSASSSCSA